MLIFENPKFIELENEYLYTSKSDNCSLRFFKSWKTESFIEAEISWAIITIGCSISFWIVLTIGFNNKPVFESIEEVLSILPNDMTGAEIKEKYEIAFPLNN